MTTSTSTSFADLSHKDLCYLTQRTSDQLRAQAFHTYNTGIVPVITHHIPVTSVRMSMLLRLHYGDSDILARATEHYGREVLVQRVLDILNAALSRPDDDVIAEYIDSQFVHLWWPKLSVDLNHRDRLGYEDEDDLDYRHGNSDILTATAAYLWHSTKLTIFQGDFRAYLLDPSLSKAIVDIAGSEKISANHVTELRRSSNPRYSTSQSLSLLTLAAGEITTSFYLDRGTALGATS